MDPAKLHASLAAAVMSPPHEEESIPIILKVRRGPIARGEARALSEVEPGHSFHLVDARSTAATHAQIAALTEDPAVELIWPDLPVHTWLDVAVPFIQAPRVWESGFTGRGVKLAILDTGLDPDHPDFVDRLLAYRDFVDPDGAHAADPQDPNGHGTHVTGVAAGSGEGSDGRYRGVAPEAELLIGRALDAAGNGRTSQVMASIEWAVGEGAQVINISLGGAPFPGDGTDALSVLCNAAVAQGVVVCVAAGNLGPAKQTIGSPGAAERVITVGAAEANGDLSVPRVATFSSRGPTGDGRAKPDLVFPGVGIVGPRSADTPLGSPVSDAYTGVSGTSQATPMASGTAVLLLQANPRLSPAEMKSRMVRGARHLADVDAIAQGAGVGDSYNTFISAPGTPFDAEEPVPQEPTRPAGCLPAAISAYLIR